MTNQLFIDVIIIFSLSIIVVYIFSKLKMPPILGFFLTGIIAGPHFLQLVRSTNEVEILSEIGIVLMLFTIGLEFSIKTLMRLKKTILLGGFSQVLMTILVIAIIGLAIGIPINQSIFLGFLASLSSTAIVLKLLQSNAEVATPPGRASLAILIFQDIIIVPMMLLVPILAGIGSNPSNEILMLFAKISIISLFIWVSSKFIVPRLFYSIARTRSKELFMLSVLFFVIIIVFGFHELGLSIALGAFIAGLIVSESDYAHEAFGIAAPFRDVFSSFFFVSIGMLLDLSIFADYFVVILIGLIIVIVLKFLVTSFSVKITGATTETSLISGFSLSQIGEFSIILSLAGLSVGLIDDVTYQLFLAIAVLTMGFTPFQIGLSKLIARRLAKFKPFNYSKGYDYEVEQDLKDHLIIIGYGINGRNVARAAKIANVPYIIIELNPETVKTERNNGENIIFGDATREEILEHVLIKNAKAFVIAIADSDAVKSITKIARKASNDVYIIVRTRFVYETEALFALGANEVIPEEYETSIQIFNRVLEKYSLPKEELDVLVAELREGCYEQFRK